MIFTVGDIATSAFYLQSGSVRLATTGFDGSPITFETIERGIFGEVALLLKSPRTATAYADGPVKVWEIGVESVNKLLAADETFRQMLIHTMAARLRRSAEQLQ